MVVKKVFQTRLVFFAMCAAGIAQSASSASLEGLPSQSGIEDYRELAAIRVAMFQALARQDSLRIEVSEKITEPIKKVLACAAGLAAIHVLEQYSNPDYSFFETDSQCEMVGEGLAITKSALKGSFAVNIGYIAWNTLHLFPNREWLSHAVLKQLRRNANIVHRTIDLLVSDPELMDSEKKVSQRLSDLIVGPDPELFGIATSRLSLLSVRKKLYRIDPCFVSRVVCAAQYFQEQPSLRITAQLLNDQFLSIYKHNR